VGLDADQTELLVRMMDRLVIRMEGGSEADWLALEEQEKTSAEDPDKALSW